jgi:branched-chain amino acid transport system ATP-binding protein
MTVRCVGLTLSFGGIKALEQITFEIPTGQRVGIIGPNGSGKTSFINCLSGFYRPTAGAIVINERDLSGSNPSDFRAQGVVRTFQNLRVYDELSVEDNALLGLHQRLSGGRSYHWRWIGEALALPAARRRDREAREAVRESLERVGLGDRRGDRVGRLSYGQKKRLELSRATVGPFRCLLLDEPTAGLTREEADQVMELALELVQQEGASLVLVEHRLELVLQASDRVVLFDGGRVVADSTPAAIAADRDVLRVYMGDEGTVE